MQRNRNFAQKMVIKIQEVRLAQKNYRWYILQTKQSLMQLTICFSEIFITYEDYFLNLMKAIKKLRNNKVSLEIQAKLLKQLTFSPNSITSLLHINALWNQKGSPEDPHTYRGISIGFMWLNIHHIN